MIKMDEFEEAIRTRVCSTCIERTGRGICGTGRADDCPLNQFMPQIVRAANRVQLKSLDEYAAAIQFEVYGRSNGTPVAPETDDILATYLPLIIEVIDEVWARRARRPVH